QVTGAMLMALSLIDGAAPAAVAVPAAPALDAAPTATGALTASFVTPANGAAATVAATEVTVATQAGAAVELRANGVLVDTKHIGKRTIDRKTGETRWFYYGVPLDAGPNVIEATPLGANNRRGPSTSITVYGPGQAQAIRAEFVQHLVADGKTVAPLNVFAVDRYGHGAAPAERVEVRILSGNVSIADLPKALDAAEEGPMTARLSLPVGGYVAIPIAAGTVAGAFEMEIRIGDAYLRRSFYVEPYVRPAFVSGLASAGAGVVPGQVDGDSNPDNGGARRNRIALFATGAVDRSGKTLLTAAYESQNRLAPLSSLGAPVDSPNSRPYLTYGDTSTIADPYRSQDHFYARIDHGKSTALWGEYQANVGPADVGSYQQLLNGAHVDLSLGRTGRLELRGFTARNQQAFVSTILPINGLAKLNAPLHPDIVVGSELLRLVTLDRGTGLMIRQTPLVRNVDYTIDYATGLLRFINIPLPYDPLFNPQVISLQYEYQGAGVSSQTTGGQASYALTRDGRSILQASYVNDATGTGNFTLGTQSFARTWNGGGFSISHAASRGSLPNFGGELQLGGQSVPSAGDALSVSLTHRSATNAIDLGYQATTAGYSDPFGGFSSPGTRASHAEFTHGSPANGQLHLRLAEQSQSGVGATSNEIDASVNYLRSIGKYVTVGAGLTQHRQSVAGVEPAPSASPNGGYVALANTNQTQLDGQVAYHGPHRLGLMVSEALTISGSDVGSTQPSQTALEASYEMPKRGRLFARELLSTQPSATFANSTTNLNVTTASTRSFQFGIEQPLSPSTTIRSEYVMDQTGNGANMYDALGIDERLRLNANLAANLTAQAANAVGAGAQGFTVLGAAVTYAPSSNRFRSSLSYQDRTGASAGSTISAAMAGRLTDDLSAVGFIQRAYGNGVHAIDDRISLAYRPQRSDRWISLFDYERANGTLLSGEAANVASFEELFRPTHRLELAGRFAYKFDGGGVYAARTTLWSARATQRIGSRQDIAIEARTAMVPGATGARTTEVAAETGVTLGSTARVALGYTISGSVDPTLLGQPQHQGLYLTFTTLIDRIFGWGKQH
ncbi:MAG TPA: hypothetical protein VFN49_12665, partial [Candidatus Aquilonibacter sp.]|nr:hypothetical protein [Candidatus Aquilonibacter sp.]